MGRIPLAESLENRRLLSAAVVAASPFTSSPNDGTVTLVLSINDDGYGDFTPNAFAIYAIDGTVTGTAVTGNSVAANSGGIDGGIANFDIAVSGAISGSLRDDIVSGSTYTSHSGTGNSRLRSSTYYALTDSDTQTGANTVSAGFTYSILNQDNGSTIVGAGQPSVGTAPPNLSDVQSQTNDAVMIFGLGQTAGNMRSFATTTSGNNPGIPGGTQTTSSAASAPYAGPGTFTYKGITYLSSLLVADGRYVTGSPPTINTGASSVGLFAGLNEAFGNGGYSAAGSGTVVAAISQTLNSSPDVATQLVFSQQPTNATAGNFLSPSVTVALKDSGGSVVTTDDSNVTLTVATGPGTLGGDTTVAAVNGVATFSGLSLRQAGAYTLAATDSADGLTVPSSPSSSFIITAGAATNLVFTTQPANGTAGTTLSAVTVTIEDAFGNTTSGDSSVIILAGVASLTGTTSVSATAGVAIFSTLSITKSGGGLTFTASDSADGLSGFSSKAFSVAPAVAAKLAFAQQPSSTMAAGILAPAVAIDIEDQFGNLKSGNTSTVMLSVATGPGSLDGTTAVAAVAGVATFPNLSLDLVGTYNLSADDGALSGAQSSAFNVTAGLASKLAFVQEPTNVIVGAAITPAITVQVEDQFGNLETTDASTVTLLIATGSGALSGTTSVAAVNGVASFSGLSLATTGTYVLSAGDGSLAGAESSAFTVTPLTVGAASKLVFIQQPTNANSGGGIAPPITVDVEDSSGNVVPTDDSSVTLALENNTSGAVLGGTTTTAAIDGTATFGDLTITPAGTYSLSATDGSLTGAGSVPFDVADVAVKLVFVDQPPSGVISGTTITPPITVDLEDANSNPVAGDNSTVVLAIASGGPASDLTGTTAVQAVNGIAMFSDVAVSATGTFALSATNGSLMTAPSSTFDVTAPTPAFASLVGGTLTVNGTSGDDVIILSSDGANVTATLNGTPAQTFSLSTVTSITVNGNAGNDNITIESNLPQTLGVSVQGGPGDDTITGGAGNDRLGGGQGNDYLSGGPGDDSIKGGAGDDTLLGGKGNDTVLGGPGNDLIHGGLGDDYLNGGAGTNFIGGGLGNNTFYAVNGNADQIFAGTATNDVLFYSTSDSPIIESGSILMANKTLVS